jgi:hypothetical protein
MTKRRLYCEQHQSPWLDNLTRGYPRDGTLARMVALWASSSTKNPAYPDTLYVDNLIGRDTVNTLPEITIATFEDHGSIARTIDTGVDDADAVMHNRRQSSHTGATSRPVGSGAHCRRRRRRCPRLQPRARGHGSWGTCLALANRLPSQRIFCSDPNRLLRVDPRQPGRSFNLGRQHWEAYRGRNRRLGTCVRRQDDGPARPRPPRHPKQRARSPGGWRGKGRTPRG